MDIIKYIDFEVIVVPLKGMKKQNWIWFNG